MPDAGLIRDLTNASKRVELDSKKQRPSTPMHHTTTSTSLPLNPSLLVMARATIGREARMMERGRDILFDGVAKAPCTFWQDLINEVEPT